VSGALSPEVKQLKHKAYHLYQAMPRSEVHGATHPLPYTSLWSDMSISKRKNLLYRYLYVLMFTVLYNRWKRKDSELNSITVSIL
jgi:hypothetical protein